MTDILAPTPGGLLEVVYLGGCTLQGNKAGNRWILKDALDTISSEKGVDAVELARRVSSAFGKKGTGGRVIGGVYRAKGEQDGDSLKSLNFGTLQFIGRSSSPLIPAFEAADVNARETEYTSKAERAAKAEPVFMRDMNRTLETLRKMPYRQALSCIDAISAELRRQVLTRG